jgi:cytochrome c-type biogenesis protein CcmH/NrfG
LQKAVDLGGGQDWQCFDMLGGFYNRMGRMQDAIQAASKALDLAVAGRNPELVRILRAKLAGYRQPR